MKKKLLLSAMMFASMGAMAQLPPNSWAPDFTATDLDGNTQHLYDYLDQGYTVILDISATWCGPCWSYHNSGALENLYDQYGPGTTEDKVMVFMVEGDGSTTVAELNGIGGSTQGDWVTGTPYPIMDNAGIADDYEITYFPTIYMICPNRIVNEVGQPTTAQLWNMVQQDCAAATSGSNAALPLYNGPTVICDELTASVTLQNMGTDNLTSASIAMKEGASTLATQDWTGDLSTYNTAVVNFPATTVTDAAAVTFEITSVDANAADNTLDPNLSSAVSSMANLTFTLNLDYYCSETTWKLFNSSNVQVQAGGPYNCGGNGGGADAHKTKTYNWTLPMDCYHMEIYDAYGDGMSSTAYGHSPDGSWDLMDGGAHHVFTGAGNFGSMKAGGINVNMPAGIGESTLDNSLSVYPNPSNGDVFLSYQLTKSARVTVEVFNALGELVLANTTTVPAGVQVKQMDLGSLNNGIYFMNINADGLKASRTITLNK